MSGSERGGYYRKVSRGHPLWAPFYSWQPAPERTVVAVAAAKAVKAVLVLIAPLCALLIDATASGSLPDSEIAQATTLMGRWLSGTAMIAWVLSAAMWLIIHLFSSGHHRLRPLHETLAIPAWALYLAAFAPHWPHVVLGPWGGAS